ISSLYLNNLKVDVGISQTFTFSICFRHFPSDMLGNCSLPYCKRPFFGPSQVIEYLGRYTHKIAISNHRIKSLESGYVRFMVKEYRHGGKKSVLKLSDAEFIRRFSLHIPPKGFTRIRHYGILSSYYKRTIIPELQEELGKPKLPETTPLLHRKCPACKKGNLSATATFTARAPPLYWQEQIKKQLNRPI